MPSSYPSGYDSLPTSWQGTDYQSTVDHAGTHNRLAEAVMAIQQELGLSPSDSWETVRARLDAMASAAPLAHKASHAAGGTDALTPADIGAVPASVLTTKGDLLTHNGTALVRRPVGADGTLLVADSSQADGLRWGYGAYRSVAASGPITLADHTVDADTTAQAVTLTLPSAAAAPGKMLRVVTNAGSLALTIARSGSDLIGPGGKTSATFPTGATCGEVMLVSTGSGWRLVSGQASDETAGRRVWKWSQALAASSASSTVGFQLLYFDSGWRDVSALLENGWTSAAVVRMRRENGLVTLSVPWTGLNGSAKTSNQFLTLPSGFRTLNGGSAYGVGVLAAGFTGALTNAAMIHVVGQTNLQVGPSAPQYTFLVGELRWRTDDPVPSTLPGLVSGGLPT